MNGHCDNSKLRFQTFPRSMRSPDIVKEVVACFDAVYDQIDSTIHKSQKSDLVLRKVSEGLSGIGFQVEKSKKNGEKIPIPVLMGHNDKAEKSFFVDAYNKSNRIIVEVEAGQAVTNFRFLKDIFEACQMPAVDHLVIAVRNIYEPNNNSDDFSKVCTFLETLYVNGRLKLPLMSVTVIGY